MHLAFQPYRSLPISLLSTKSVSGQLAGLSSFDSLTRQRRRRPLGRGSGENQLTVSEWCVNACVLNTHGKGCRDGGDREKCLLTPSAAGGEDSTDGVYGGAFNSNRPNHNSSVADSNAVVAARSVACSESPVSCPNPETEPVRWRSKRIQPAKLVDSRRKGGGRSRHRTPATNH